MYDILMTLFVQQLGLLMLSVKRQKQYQHLIQQVNTIASMLGEVTSNIQKSKLI